REGTRRHFNVEEGAEIACRSSIGKIERAFLNSEVELNKPQNAAEIVADIADKARGRISGDDKQRDAKAILVVALVTRQNRRRLVVVPAAPIIPCDEYGSIVPVTHSVAVIIVPDGIDNGCDPRRPASVAPTRVIRILGRGNDPADGTKLAVGDILQDIGRPKVDIVVPLRSRAVASGP